MEADTRDLAFCPLLFAVQERQLRQGHCSFEISCGRCQVFHDYMEEHEDELAWICPLCLSEDAADMTYLGFYTSMECDLCDRHSSICQAAVRPDYISRSQWGTMQRNLLDTE